MLPEYQTAIRAALAAGQILRQHYRKPHQISFKGVIDLVTEIDGQSESLIHKLLEREYPNYGFLGEETGEVAGSKKSRWIVDPLDGTTNYAKGYPLFAVSIALEKNNEIVLGVVYNPLTDEMFAAEKGLGATLNGQPIHVSETLQLEHALLASGFPYDVWTSPLNNLYEWEQFLRKTVSIRCDGSAALDLCRVAAGCVDGYWEYSLGAWDMAAGALMVEEAGGRISLISGASFEPYRKNILATNRWLHEAMLEVLNFRVKERDAAQ